jgi:hypothetical protein
VLLPHLVCNALVAGGRRSGAGQQLCVSLELLMMGIEVPETC